MGELQGKIKKGIGSFYTVIGADGLTVTCKARGRFRNEHITPLIGDNVLYELEPDGTGYLLGILQRKNELVRPPVANIDKLVIVISANTPRPDLLLLDKLLVCCLSKKITPVVVINKQDIAKGDTTDEVISEYSPMGISIIKLSAHDGSGISELLSELAGGVACLAGQSAVGKSSLINALIPGLELEVGDLSLKTERGRHTTRHVELWQTESGGMIFDTPGFSLFETMDILPEELGKYYPEMQGSIGKCRFPACLHVSEPGCAVKMLLNQTPQKLSDGRYARYKEILTELIDRYKHRYD